MTDEELSALTRAYVYETDDVKATEMLAQIRTEHDRRGLDIYNFEE